MNECTELQIIDLVFKIIGGAITLLVFIIGFSRYKKDQNWKRKEFIAKEMKDFNSNQMVRNVQLMLDWGEREIELYFENPNFDKRFVTVDRKSLAKALIPHKYKSNYTKDEKIIRDQFDFFLSYLVRFENFVESGVVEIEDFKPYLRYWINVISTKLPDAPRNVLHHYIIAYDYTSVINFVERFGKEIEPNEPIEKTIKDLAKE